MLLSTPLGPLQEMQQDQECSCHCQKQQQLTAEERAEAFNLNAFKDTQKRGSIWLPTYTMWAALTDCLFVDAQLHMH